MTTWDGKPALTEEEWADPREVFDGVLGLDWGCVDIRLGGPAGIRDHNRERHALAALCLKDQSYGFKPWMVLWLNGDRRKSVLPPEIFEIAKRSHPAVYDIIAKHIAALLPER